MSFKGLSLESWSQTAKEYLILNQILIKYKSIERRLDSNDGVFGLSISGADNNSDVSLLMTKLFK